MSKIVKKFINGYQVSFVAWVSIPSNKSGSQIIWSYKDHSGRGVGGPYLEEGNGIRDYTIPTPIPEGRYSVVLRRHNKFGPAIVYPIHDGVKIYYILGGQMPCKIFWKEYRSGNR